MENYLIFDFFILFFILVSAFFSFLRGFSHESLSLINWILALLVSYNFGGKLTNLINKFVNNLFFSNGISYLLTFLMIFIFFSILTKKISSLIKKSQIGFVDRTGGFFFGILRGYLIICLCFFSFHFFYKGDKFEWIEKSKFNFVTLITNEKIVNFLEEESEFAETLRTEIDEKSEILFEKSIDSQIKLKKFIDKDNKIYNDADKKSLEYLIENSE
ncbi:CvpA family protein [Alphaproteobacteria bacterium]|nr:CvpA family protein [Alphaproteobacteria bacterium]